MKIRVILFALLATLLIYSCGNDDDGGQIILEPITFLQPDTTTVSATPGQAVALEVQLTTDRVIDSLSIEYHIDSLGQGFDPGIDPTTTFANIKWAIPDNVQTYVGAYNVPTILNSSNTVRLIFSLRAKERFYQKTLTINVQ